jgi:TorA maturation chaperone TorD
MHKILLKLNPEMPQLRDAFDTLGKLPLEQIQGEYTGLFINGYPHTPCSPHESIYLDDHILLGPAAERVSVFYRQWGLNSADQLPDHVTVELEFMHLILEAVLAADEPQKQDLLIVAQTFWNAHLGRWIAPFANDLKANAKLGFYRQLGEFILDFAVTEQPLWEDNQKHVHLHHINQKSDDSDATQPVETFRRMT